MPKMIPTSQAPTKAGSAAPTNHATKSGSRPTGGKHPIKSSAPANAQKFRG